MHADLARLLVLTLQLSPAHRGLENALEAETLRETLVALRPGREEDQVARALPRLEHFFPVLGQTVCPAFVPLY